MSIAPQDIFILVIIFPQSCYYSGWPRFVLECREEEQRSGLKEIANALELKRNVHHEQRVDSNES